MPIQDVGDGILIDLNPQFPQFTLDLAIAPVPVLQRQPDDQLLSIPGCARTSTLRTLLIGPLSLDQRAVPADSGVWFEDPYHITQLCNGAIAG